MKSLTINSTLNEQYHFNQMLRVLIVNIQILNYNLLWMCIISLQKNNNKHKIISYFYALSYICLILWTFHIVRGDSLGVGKNFMGWALGWVIQGPSSMSTRTFPSFSSIFTRSIGSSHQGLSGQLVVQARLRDTLFFPVRNGNKLELGASQFSIKLL